MVDPLTVSRLSHWIIYLLIAVAVLLFRYLPLGQSDWPAPQIMLVLPMVWAIRRPDYVPILLVAVVGIWLDFLLGRPPGLMAALLVISTEFLRQRSYASREWPFTVEWVVAGIILVAILVVNRLVLSLFVVDQPALIGEIKQLSSTLIAYPAVVFISVRFLGLSRPRAEVSLRGQAS